MVEEKAVKVFLIRIYPMCRISRYFIVYSFAADLLYNGASIKKESNKYI